MNDKKTEAPTDGASSGLALANGSTLQHGRIIYRTSETPEVRPCWMWDAHMRYWKRWEPGWGRDNLWTHWTPDSPTAPEHPPLSNVPGQPHGT